MLRSRQSVCASTYVPLVHGSHVHLKYLVGVDIDVDDGVGASGRPLFRWFLSFCLVFEPVDAILSGCLTCPRGFSLAATLSRSPGHQRHALCRDGQVRYRTRPDVYANLVDADLHPFRALFRQLREWLRQLLRYALNLVG
jgi:hypothetical protein